MRISLTGQARQGHPDKRSRRTRLGSLPARGVPIVNWDAIAAVGELIGAIAVVTSLLYLSIQLKTANKQAEVESLRHIADSLNEVCDSFSRDLVTAGIINRGRRSLDELDEDESLIFVNTHIRLLNTLESWYTQIEQTSKPGPYRERHLSNIADIAEVWLGYPGTRDLWGQLGQYFGPVQGVIDEALGKPVGYAPKDPLVGAK